jgi:catechol 2,3-dioxygenase-like lactoylglutathione lyase family enzyme
VGTRPTTAMGTAMTDVQQRSEDHPMAAPAVVDLRLEVIVIPVSDAERAREFYTRLGWRADADLTVSEDFRVLQFTPPGSGASVIFGTGVSSAAPGSAQGLHLVVSDVVAARSALVVRGIEVGEVFHDSGGIFHHIGDANRTIGLAPENADYGSFASFSDPDGNGWLLQEINTRAPGR